MDGIPLTYALDAQGRLVNIHNVKNGLECGCFCPHCKQEMVAKNGGTRKVAHFAHRPGLQDCGMAEESALHLLAKEILLKEMAFYLPDYKDFQKFGKIKLTDVREEKYDDETGRRPDIVATLEDGTELFIEIKNTHMVDEEKRQSLINNGKTCIEVDVSGQELDEEKLREFLVDRKEKRHWINAPRLQEKHRLLCAEKQPLLQYMEEFPDLSDYFVQDAILHKLMKFFKDPQGEPFILSVVQFLKCKYYQSCDIKSTNCSKIYGYKSINLNNNCPQVTFYEQKHVLQVTFPLKPKKTVTLFFGFIPCDQTKLRDRIYVSIKSLYQIKKIFNDGINPLTDGVQYGQELSLLDAPNSNCQYPSIYLYGTGNIVVKVGKNVDNRDMESAQLATKMTDESIDEIQKALPEIQGATEYLKIFGIHEALKRGCNGKNCLICKYHQQRDIVKKIGYCTKRQGDVMDEWNKYAFACDYFEEDEGIRTRLEEAIQNIHYSVWPHPYIKTKIDIEEAQKAFTFINPNFNDSDWPF